MNEAFLDNELFRFEAIIVNEIYVEGTPLLTACIEDAILTEKVAGAYCL